MNKILLSTLLFASIISTLKAQIYTPSGTIQGVSLNDNVGIGTNQSIAKLTIKAGFESQPTPLKAISIWGPNSPGNSNSAQDLSWDFASAGSASIRSYRGSSWDTYLQFLTNSNIGGNAPQVRMHIDYAGNVGIGTTTPSDPLTIQTNSTANALSLINRTSGDDYSNILFKSAAGNAFAGFGNASGRIRIMTGGVGDTFERFTVLANGNVGIGTLEPAFKLDLIGSLSVGSQNVNSNTTKIFLRNPVGKTWAISSGANMITESSFSIYNWTDNQTAPFFHIIANGNVGIGTSTPEAKLDVKGAIKSYEPIPLGSAINSSQLINESGASCGTGNRLYNRIWMFRDNASKADWYTTRLHDGISIDFSFGSPQVDTRTWWERDPSDNIQSWGNAAETYVTINKGNVGIGTTNPTSKLTVAGNIHSREVKVTVDAGADFVFEKDYNLPSLDSVHQYIKENKHLPEIASAKEMQTNGINLSEMNIKLLQKVEELTLYTIEQNKKLEIQQTENNIQSKKIEALEKENEAFKSLSERLLKLENQSK